MKFRGRIANPNKNIFFWLVFPLVVIKKYFESLQLFFTRLIWQELTGKKKNENRLIDLSISVFFLFFSAIFYYLEKYENIIFLSFLLIWYFDFLLAHQSYTSHKNKIFFSLDNSSNGKITWQMRGSNSKTAKDIFLAEEVKNIWIAQHQIRGGNFNELLGTVWRVSIGLSTGDERTLGDYKQAIDAFKRSKLLANYFTAPVIFASSQGQGRYAGKKINIDDVFQDEPQIVTQKKSDRFHIYYRWRLINYWNFIGEIWQKSGLILFILIASNVMFNCGKFFHNYIVQNTIYFPNIFDFFMPKFGLIEGLELTLAIALIIYRGWQISRSKHIYIDRDYLEFCLERKSLGKLITKEIETILLIDAIKPTILLLSPQKALTISDFHTEAEYIAFFVKISQAVAELQNKSV